ncbi:unnamed protein product [Rotaria socialis]|uniref:Receptor ligand binding region domain-containing protein n=1 Tax=Rotaria socialis TaxID=392032 RepID=A0A819XSY9_9BILA|nr:unnamed protein product [Rotaria socialis]CAF3480872.1 unnamed protein product [Rotaria socialis]CAF4122968.1 unnamed protein product [Rotaria socialis]CAF4147618.1 unnamed protein product [Rotaria socialis]
MLLFWNIRWDFVCILCVQLHVIYYVRAIWPSPNSSNVKLLGIFENVSSSSESAELYIHSQAMFKSAVILSQEYNITIEDKYIEWHSIETVGHGIETLRDTCKVLSISNVAGIVGPGLSSEAHVIASFAKIIGIPAISYSATDPDLSDRSDYPNFYRTIPSDKMAAKAIVKLFERFHWKSCILIYQNDAFGMGGNKIITDEFNKNNLTVRGSIIFSISTHHMQEDFHTYLLESESRIVILWIQSNYIPVVLKEALKYDVVGPEFIWILSSSISLDSFDRSYEKLIGLLTVEPVAGISVSASINATLLDAAYKVWQKYESETFPVSSKVHSYALFAFDTTWLLAQSLQKLCSTIKTNSSSSSSSSSPSSSSCLSFNELSFCFDRRFSQSDLLLNTINQIEFLGGSGPVKFDSNDLTDRVNGSYYYVQNLQSFTNGLHFVPVLKYGSSNDWTPIEQTNTILWPGNSSTIPNDHPMITGKILHITVFESMPFTMITDYINEYGYNEQKIIGFIPDLIELLEKRMGFHACIHKAPSNQTYSGLIEAVARGDYDTVFGDVRVTAARKESTAFSHAIFYNSLRVITRRTPDIDMDFFYC